MRVRLAALVALAALAAQPAAAAPLRPANRCLTLAFAGGTAGPFYFKATGLGRFMLGDKDGKVLAETAEHGTERAAEPGPAAEWALGDGALRATASRRFLVLKDGVLGTGTSVVKITLRRASGCRAWPEASLGARGKPFRGKRKNGTVFGFADAHFH